MAVIAESHWVYLLVITTLYLCSHVLRMFRLVLLTLDKRNSVLPLVTAHALTALPSSFLPFKLGEVLRLTAFFCVFDARQKAIAVWLAERFGDVLVISAFILGFYLLEINVPSGMRAVFIIFVLASGLCLVGMFAVAKVFVYLNRHLVTTSLSPRGLLLLRTSHVLRSLEMSIHGSLRGGCLVFCSYLWRSGPSRYSPYRFLLAGSLSANPTSLNFLLLDCWLAYLLAVKTLLAFTSPSL